MFHVKHFTITFLSLLFFTGTFAQYTKYSYFSKQEPAINILTDDEINKNISSQTQKFHLNKQEKEALYWLDFARKYPRRFYNEVVYPYATTYPEMRRQKQYLITLKKSLYASKPVPFFVLDEKLQYMAQAHAIDAKENSPSIAHFSSSGKDFPQRAKEAGLNVCAGENLSYGASSVLMQLILLYLDIGQPNLGHRENLLNPLFTNIGLAVVRLNSEDVFFVQDFSCAPSPTKK